MANEGDLASDYEIQLTQVAIQNARNQAPARLKPKGTCHYCKSPAKPEQVFCDEDCAEDYAYEQERLAINGPQL